MPWLVALVSFKQYIVLSIIKKCRIIGRNLIVRKSFKILALPLLGLWALPSSLPANDYFSEMPPEMICRVSADLYLQDLCNLELVSRKFASVLQDAYQYKAFLKDYTPATPLYSSTPLTSKKIFLYYKKRSHEFRCHLGTLWEFYFPAIPTLDFGLAYYWGSHLRFDYLKKIRESFPLHPFEVDLEILKMKKSTTYFYIDPKEEEEIVAACPIALIRTLMEAKKHLNIATMRRRGDGLPSPDYTTAREEYRAILALRPKVDPESEVEAHWQLAEMNRLGEGINAPDWAAARLGYLAVLQSPGAGLEKTMLVLTTLAEMDYEGQGLCHPDYIAARDKALTVLFIPNALPWAVEHAKSLLSKMEQHKVGLRTSEHLSFEGREHYTWVIYSSFALPEAKISAQFKLAEMNHWGHGSQAPDYTAARQGYRSVITLPFIGPNLQKIMAQFHLAEMNYYGRGIEGPDYLLARKGYTIVLNSSFDLPKEKIKAQFHLAEMDYYGQGIKAPNYAAAYASYKAVINSHHTNGSTRGCAQFKLAQMYHQGLGIPKPDYAAACDMYEAVINSSEASATMREGARKAWVLADIALIRKN